MGPGKRLTYYIEKQGYTKKEYCNIFAFEYNNMVNILADTRPLGINLLNRVHESLPKLNMHWLLYGEGPEEINGEIINQLNEPIEMYAKQPDIIEDLLIKYLQNQNVKAKIHEIIEEK